MKSTPVCKSNVGLFRKFYNWIKNIPVVDHVNKVEMKKIIEDIIEKNKEITPLLKKQQFINLKKKLNADRKELTRKDIFEYLFSLIKPNSEFDLLLILKVE